MFEMVHSSTVSETCKDTWMGRHVRAGGGTGGGTSGGGAKPVARARTRPLSAQVVTHIGVVHSNEYVAAHGWVSVSGRRKPESGACVKSVSACVG